MSKKGRKVYRDGDGTEHLDCNKCQSVQPLSSFVNKKNGFYGKSTSCKACDRKRIEEWKARPENKDKVKAIHKRNNDKRKERYGGVTKPKPTTEEQRQKRLYDGHIYRTRRRNMTNTLTAEQYETILNQYHNKCCLTGASDVHLDHVIPLATGHAGTVYENMIPLSGALNSSKQAYNIFEWAIDKHKDFGFSMEHFHEVMTEVAERNGMTFEEFKSYVYACHANPKEVETHYNQSQWYVSFYNRLEKAIDMYQNGSEPKQEIPKETGISQSTLLKHMQKRGIPRRRHGVANWEERLQEAIELYRQGIVLREIYKKTGTHKNTLFRELKRLGIPKRKTETVTQEMIDTAIDRYVNRRENGEVVEDILKTCGMGKKRLYEEIDRRGLRDSKSKRRSDYGEV